MAIQSLNGNRAKRTRTTPGSVGMKCSHCERKMGDFAGGSSRGYNNEQLCHPNAANRPDCYALVTQYNHKTPCDRAACYEDHDEFLKYVDNDEKLPTIGEK